MNSQPIDLSRQILPATALSEAQALGAAQLIQESFPGYYGLLDLPHPAVTQLLKTLLQSDRSDLYGNTDALILNEEVIGITVSYPVQEYKTWQSVGLAALLEQLPPSVKQELLVKLKGFGKKFSPALPESGYYLARFAIAESFRGLCHSEALLEYYFLKGKAFPHYCLHVEKQNQRAIRFYEKQGFTIIKTEDEAPVEYISMERKNQGSDFG